MGKHSPQRSVLALLVKALPRSRRPPALLTLSPTARRLYELLRQGPGPVDFDPEEYLRRNPDVAEAGIDPLSHFVQHGAGEGREASPGVSAHWYADMNGFADEAAAEALIRLAEGRATGTRRRAAFFGYAWNGLWRLDAYMREIVVTLAALGVDVDVYLGNQFTERHDQIGFIAALPREDLGRFMAERAYDFALSFNNALVIPETVKALGCTIVTISVDSVNHHFDHGGTGALEAFRLPIHAAPIYTSLVEDLRAAFGTGIAATFLPAATRIEDRAPPEGAGPIAISWIASMVGDHWLDQFMARLPHLKDGPQIVADLVAGIKRTGSLGTDAASERRIASLCEWSGWDRSALEVQLQNVATNASRLATVEALAPLGLEVFGNDRWSSAFFLSPKVLRSFRSGAGIRRHADLCAIYDRSKISVNVPQAQAATGMQYRILDILASPSLLITKHVPGSDLERLFGADSPVVTYTDLDDLKAKCAYYLTHEEERLARVRACNAMVARGYSFPERVREYLTLSNPEAAVTVSADDGPGTVAMVSVAMVRKAVAGGIRGRARRGTSAARAVGAVQP